MDKKSQNTNQVPTVTNSFNKGMVKDVNETFIGEGMYTHARNAVNNSYEGNVGVIGNEPSNLFCVNLPYTPIGIIYMEDDKWIVFSTNNVVSEIGIFDESECSYVKIVSADCLNFKTTHLITGVFRKRFDCDNIVYWDDGLNPSRILNLSDVPFKFKEKIKDGCVIKEFTTELNCEAIRLATLIKHPCIKMLKGAIAGTLENGSYQAYIAYTINQVRVTDYIGLSNIQSVFSHEDASSSLEIEVLDVDKNFDEFELVVLANIEGQSLAKKIGYYSTSQGKIYVDRWSADFLNIPVSDLVFRSEPVEKTDATYSVSNYLLRAGVYSKFKFNYQPLANIITTKWVAVQYPSDYYIKGGSNVGYMRDEQYSFFIRWVYNTGERSESYHIPGRESTAEERANFSSDDTFETLEGIAVRRWQVTNTGTITSLNKFKNSDDEGLIIASGSMGYWESTERYPADKQEVWGKLCGKPIRHHKFPDETVGPMLSTFQEKGSKITLLGVQFENIKHPLDENGNPIESIVGYEILRGSRSGNKSIIAKGQLNNLRQYDVPENPTIKGLYQNYPYNDLRPDSYLTYHEQTGENGSDNPGSPKLSVYKNDMFSFHSPELSFSNPFLNANELKIYQQHYGTSNGYFEVPYQHPKFKLITDGLDTALDTFAVVVQVIQAFASVSGGGAMKVGSKTDLPEINSSVPRVIAEGPLGTISSVALGIAVGVNFALTLAHNLLFGTRVTKEQLLSMVMALLPNKQFASQYNSHGFYNEFAEVIPGSRRRKIIESGYVGSSIQQFTSQFQINNVNRSKFVALKIAKPLANPNAAEDKSRFVMSEKNLSYYQPASTPICSYYGAIKIPIPSQYGQLESIKQIPISGCINVSEPVKGLSSSTPVLFGGDTYINRFTEKNTMFFFNTWLRDEPDNVDFNYTLYPAMPYPRYWLNSQKYIGLFNEDPSDLRSLDSVDTNWFYLRRGYFYLFNSGVRDFYVESEINLAYRDWEDEVTKRHYDPLRYTDLTSMFRSDVIVSGNYYKYDYSLSVSKLVNSQISWGELLPRDYNIEDYSKCYTYRPNRVIYSLPQQDTSKKDNWRVFLVNNYKEFLNPITSIKPINKTGALFMMRQASPLQFLGVEELKLDGTNTKVTIGDGGLFTGPSQLQAIVNADQSFEYGSNQSRFSTIGTTKGIFWVSQNQGKIFQYAGQLNEISNSGMRWWFAKYLPSELITKFPNYKLRDNPLAGVGVQMMYDNTTEVLYVTKKDYRLLKDDITLSEDGYNFLRNGNVISISNRNYFEELSWTISYDTKTQTWISFHDWKPTLMLPSRTHFMTIKDRGVWKHNIRCDSYCNFYRENYPFEIEFVSATGQQVMSMKSVEYLLEVYNYVNDCRDKFHVLDENFDKAIIYNSEQISGILNLKIKRKNSPSYLYSQPSINNSSIDVFYSKEEQKYRFNQFWDITTDRGEFTKLNTAMFITKPNGYEFSINPKYVNYSKSPLNRKKFRHNVNRVFLRKTVSGKNKMLFKVFNQKSIPSYR